MARVITSDAYDEQAERQQECQRAIDDDFALLTGWAESAGWSWQEISLALMELIEQYVIATGSITVLEESPPTMPAKARTLH